MEDEEYYHMMLTDLERLERVHHHNDPVPELEPRPSTTRRRDSISSVLQRHMHTSHWMSELRTAFSGAVRVGIDALALVGRAQAGAVVLDVGDEGELGRRRSMVSHTS